MLKSFHEWHYDKWSTFNVSVYVKPVMPVKYISIQAIITKFGVRVEELEEVLEEINEDV